LHRQRCKACSVAPCALSGEAGDILDAGDEDVDEPEGCPHEPACPKCYVILVEGTGNPCDGCGRNLSLDDTMTIYLDANRQFLAATHTRCSWEP
jgi:hypothetical protein